MPLWMRHSKLERGGQRISSCGIPISRRTSPWTAHQRGARHGRLLPGLAQPIGDGQPARVTHEAAVLVDAVPQSECRCVYSWGSSVFLASAFGGGSGYPRLQSCRPTRQSRLLLQAPGHARRKPEHVHALAYAQRVPDHGPPAKLQESTLR